MPHGSLSIKLPLNRIIKALFASLLLSSTALAADDAGLLRCRAIADAPRVWLATTRYRLRGAKRKAKRNQAKVGQLNAMRRPRPKCSGSKSR